MVEGIAKLPVLQGLRCFYLGPSFAGVAGAMIKAALLVFHYRRRGGQPYLHSREQLLHTRFQAGRRPEECEEW